MAKCVCCRYIEHDEKTVTYAYDGGAGDLSGIIVFDIGGGGYEIVKEPESGSVYAHTLNPLYRKYMADFVKGEFKEKIYYIS